VHLLPLAAVVLLYIVPTETKVVTSITECPDFFLDKTPPNIAGILEKGEIQDQNRYKPICQTFNDKRTFMTLYDTLNKIPLFSAAKYRGGGEGRRPKPNWKIEPQVVFTNLNNNLNNAIVLESYYPTMANEKKNKNENIICNNQAGDQDYRNNPDFDRGHLFPSSYGSDQIEKMSTFTLTNIVPQQSDFNTGSWNRMENCVKCVLNEYCINNNDKIEGFVVIGALPSNSNLNNKINIPSVLWSAFCCFSKSQNSWLASAHWGENVADGPKYLQTQTLTELHRTLGIEPFPQTQCPLDTTVTRFYSGCPNSKAA
uniref:Uncharacterized protein n=1 Tax=Neolamprologus brichardi TaxID=32507 RepID=A0A3Q4FZH0_NEOBR